VQLHLCDRRGGWWYSVALKTGVCVTCVYPTCVGWEMLPWMNACEKSLGLIRIAESDLCGCLITRALQSVPPAGSSPKPMGGYLAGEHESDASWLVSAIRNIYLLCVWDTQRIWLGGSCVHKRHTNKTTTIKNNQHVRSNESVHEGQFFICFPWARHSRLTRILADIWASVIVSFEFKDALNENCTSPHTRAPVFSPAAFSMPVS